MDGRQVETLQLQHFGTSFATRDGFFERLYERINVRRTTRALDLADPNRVLEVGPGSGRLMAYLSGLGHDVVGLDLSPTVAKHIEQRWKLRVMVGTLAALNPVPLNGSFDVIIMRHVLEHFLDPAAALRTAYLALRSEGRLYLAVPNMGSWHRGFRGWSGYEPYHLHFFCVESLLAALHRAGFHVSKSATHEPLTGWPNTLARSVWPPQDRKPGDAPRRGAGRSILELGRFAAGIVLSPLRWYQSLAMRGEELTVVAVKSAR